MLDNSDLPLAVIHLIADYLEQFDVYDRVHELNKSFRFSSYRQVSLPYVPFRVICCGSSFLDVSFDCVSYPNPVFNSVVVAPIDDPVNAARCLLDGTEASIVSFVQSRMNVRVGAITICQGVAFLECGAGLYYVVCLCRAQEGSVLQIYSTRHSHDSFHPWNNNVFGSIPMRGALSLEYSTSRLTL